MKNTFIGYYEPSSREFKKLWEKCLFIIDTNVLLNLYRYSDNTRKELLKLLNSISSRLWLPYQVGIEFHNNRLKELSDQMMNYQVSVNEFDKFLNTIKEKLKSDRHPYVKNPKKYLDGMSTIIDSIKKELNAKKDSYSELLTNDIYLNEITSLYKGKVGNSYTDEELEKLYKIGETRYKNKIPPGYMDKKDNIKKYGDFIIWNQIIDISIEKKAPIIFITSEKKEDWWHIHEGKTVGPRPELINEFSKKTKYFFYMYHTNNFLENATNYLNSKIESSVIDEIKRVSIEESIEKARLIQQEAEKTKNAVRQLLNQISHSTPQESYQDLLKQYIERSKALHSSEVSSDYRELYLNLMKNYMKENEDRQKLLDEVFSDTETKEEKKN